MSVRNFFDIRYTFPGSVYILLILLMNLREIWDLIIKNLSILAQFDLIFGIVFPLITLLNSAPIGFLFSQIWQGFLWIIRKLWIENKKYYPLKVLEEMDVSGDSTQLALIYHYFGNKAEKRIDLYLSRRWDLINLFGTTLVSIALSFLTGWHIKNLLHIDSGILIGDKLWKFTCDPWSCYEVGLISTLLIISIVLMYSFKKVLRENQDMTILQIRKIKQQVEKRCNIKNGLSVLLPKEYIDEAIDPN